VSASLILRRCSPEERRLGGQATLRSIAFPGFSCQLQSVSVNGRWINLQTAVPVPGLTPRSVETPHVGLITFAYRVRSSAVQLEGFE